MPPALQGHPGLSGVMLETADNPAVPPCLHPPGAGTEKKKEGNLPDGTCWEPCLSLQEE